MNAPESAWGILLSTTDLTQNPTVRQECVRLFHASVDAARDSLCVLARLAFSDARAGVRAGAVLLLEDLADPSLFPVEAVNELAGLVMHSPHQATRHQAACALGRLKKKATPGSVLQRAIKAVLVPQVAQAVERAGRA